MDQHELNQRILHKISPPRKRKRVNWHKKLKAERNQVINEAITEIRRKMRDAPKDWERGYNSSITTLELMRNKEK